MKDITITKKNSINMFISSVLILLFLGIFVYYIGNSNSIVIATTSSFLSLSNTNDNTIATKSNSGNVGSVLPLYHPTLLYESREGHLIYQRVVNVIGYPQIESATIESGVLIGIGNVTNIHTWVNTYRTSNTTFGEGKGIMISENGQMAPWIGYGVGQIQNNGTMMFKDIIFFSNDVTGNMKFLDNVIGLQIAKVEGNNQTTKIFKW